MTTMTEIPVVDLAPYGLGVVNEDEVDTQTIRSLADSVCGAFRDIGFCYVKNHGVQQSLIDRMKAVSKTFFEKPVEYKKNYARPKTDNHGWVALERESLNPERPGDYKEAFNYSPCADIKILPDIDGFKAVMEDFYASSEALSLRIFDLVSIGLDLGDNKFMRKCHALIGQKGNCTALRSLYYPSLSTNKGLQDIKPNQVRCGEHSDYGSLTLLFQDDVGGLEIVLVVMTTTIPVLDMSRYSLDVVSQEVDTQTIRSLAESLCGAFRDVGFCYITNHGFKQSLIDRTMEVACTFFEMPVEYKNMYRRPSDAFYGWIPQGTESLNQVNRFDYKEAYNYPPVDGTELIPDVKDYKVTMEEFRASCYTLGHRLFDLMSVGMALEDRDFLRKCHTLLGKKGNTSGLRSIYYPPLPPNKDIKPNQVRCGEHSDYGSLTLLFQDDAGGLEVRNSRGEFVPATPIPGTILINIGDLMQRWTSDKLKATKHRILMPEEDEQKSRKRQSVAFFIQPDDDVVIRSLDGSNKYEPISSLQYLKEQIAPTY